jgi:glutamine synthetase
MTNGNEQYDSSPRGYLSRARDRLLGDGRADLFYAALELRFFVEARQNAYTHAQKRYLKSVPPAHRIGRQAAALRKLFNSDQILRLDLDFYDVPPIPLHYTPVTSDLKNSAEKLGDLLHVKDDTRDDA